MQVSIETTSSVERRMAVGVPSERIEPEIQSRLKSLKQKTKVNGFRPGKVPIRVIEQKYGQKVRQEVFGEILNKSFYEAITQEKLRVIGEPSFDIESDVKQLEQGLSYTVTFEIYPEITTLHVEGLPIEKPVAKVTESDIDIMLERLRQQRQTWNEVDRSANEGDRIIIDFVGTINGQPFKGNEVKQVPVILGQQNFLLPDLEKKLVGIRAGESREFDLTFPNDHKNTELAGQTVHFVVHALRIDAQQLPEIDVEFAKSFGVPDGSIATLRMDARHNMERELEYAIKGKMKQQVLDALVKANPIEVPPSLVEEETQHLFKIWQQEQQGQDLPAEMFKDEAIKRVKIGLLVGELIKIHNIQVQSDQVRQMIEKIAFAYENPEAMIQEFYADKKRLQEVESMVLENTVVEWLRERAQITEKQMDFYTAVMMESNQILNKQVAN